MLELFHYPLDDSLLLTGIYDAELVVISAFIAIFASVMALQMAGQIHRSQHRPTRYFILGSGSLAFGGGVWAMHFVGMLSLKLDTTLAYDPAMILWSLLPALLAAMVAMNLLSKPQVSTGKLLLGGCLMGAGICTMHYTGMAALEMAPVLRYDLGLFLLSVLIAMVLSIAALWLRFRFARVSGKHDVIAIVLGGSVLGLAITAMHHLGMMSARFVGSADLNRAADTANADFLAFAISFVTVAFTLLAVGANGLVRYREVVLRLRDSEEKFRSLIDNIPGISYRCLPDNNWSMLYISDAIEEYTGYPAADFMPGGGRTFGDIIHPDDAARLEQEVFAGGDVFNVEYRIIRRDGHIRHVWENGNLIRNRHGEIKWLDGVILDITQRYEMEQALRNEKSKAEEAVAAKTSFLANISHEIRTPMNAIIGFTEVLLQGDVTAEQKQHLKTIHTATDSLLHLLNDILDAAKLEKGLVELSSNSFSLLQTLQQVMATLAAGASKKSIVLRLEYDPSLSEFFRGDEQRLRQIILNLVGNAVKFTHQGEVVISATHENELVCIRVRDTGIGIAADRLDTIFSPFTQADASMARRYGGTGLGTTISKQLVELMGGDISVVSEPGVGSVFTLRIPLPTGDVASNSSLQTAVVLPPLRILVVDDVLPNIQLLEILLRKGSHQVVTAVNGEEALLKFKQESFDVVLMDVQMPVMDGLQASRQIRAYEQREAKIATPIIALTASVLEEDRLAAVEAGMDGFATKPINLRVLYAEIARLLNLSLKPIGEESRLIGRQAPTDMIAVREGLNTWQSRSAYFQSLERFARETRTLPDQLHMLRAARNMNGIKKLLHQVKGVAANLALLPLVQTIDSLASLDDDAEPAVWDEKANGLALILGRTRMDIETLIAHSAANIPSTLSSATPDTPVAEFDLQEHQHQIKMALDKLRSALDVNQIDDDALRALGEVAVASGYVESFKNLELAVADFEFTNAIKHLNLLQRLLTAERD